MSRRQTAVASASLAVLLHLAGCERPPSSPADARAKPSSAAVPGAAERTAAQQPPAASNDPRAVLVDWATAVSRRDWAAVRGLWGERGERSGLSPAAFAARWSTLRAPQVSFGAGEQGGAAGSVYYTAPVTIRDGTRTVAGTVVLRRANDVPGATAEQLPWHVDRADLPGLVDPP